jgi:uncharacterized DUF497 family protein
MPSPPKHSRYEWDEAKRKSNLSKHGIDFVAAALGMEGRRLDVTTRYHDEDRWIALTMVGNRLVAVVYSVRDGSCRIISARAARKNERKAYYAHFGG